MDTSAFEMATMPAAITAGVTFMIQQVGVIINIVSVNIILSLGIVMWVCGGGIGLFKRLV